MPIPRSQYRTIGDSPRYLVKSPVRDLVVIPVSFDITTGTTITARAATPTSVRLEVIDTTTVRVHLPFAVVPQQATGFFMTRPWGNFRGIVRTQVAALGYVDIKLATSFSGRVNGVITCSRSSAVEIGAGEAEPGANLKDQSLSDRSVYPSSTLVEGTTCFMLRFRALAGGSGEIYQSAYRGPLGYVVEKVPATTGQYRMTMTWGLPFLTNWSFFGNTDLLKTIEVLSVTNANDVILQVRDAAGAAANLGDEEKVQIFGIGPTTKAGQLRYEGSVRQGGPGDYAQVYPLKTLIRDPVLMPFAGLTDAAGAILPDDTTVNAIPIGTFLTQSDGANGELRFILGTVPLQSDEAYSPWLTAVVVNSLGTAIEIFYDPHVEGKVTTVTDPVPGGAHQVYGLVLASTNSEW